MSCTLVVVANGSVGEQIARIGERVVECDAQERRIVRRGDSGYPSEDVIAMWGRSIAAAVLNDHNASVALLTIQRATRIPWIEDAFLRASQN